MGQNQEKLKAALHKKITDLVPDTTIIDDDTELFKTGLIDSMNSLVIIEFIEKARGERIELRDLSMKKLQTIKSIYEHYLQDYE